MSANVTLTKKIAIWTLNVFEKIQGYKNVNSMCKVYFKIDIESKNPQILF